MTVVFGSQLAMVAEELIIGEHCPSATTADERWNDSRMPTSRPVYLAEIPGLYVFVGNLGSASIAFRR